MDGNFIIRGNTVYPRELLSDDTVMEDDIIVPETPPAELDDVAGVGLSEETDVETIIEEHRNNMQDLLAEINADLNQLEYIETVSTQYDTNGGVTQTTTFTQYVSDNNGNPNIVFETSYTERINNERSLQPEIRGR